MCVILLSTPKFFTRPHSTHHVRGSKLFPVSSEKIPPKKRQGQWKVWGFFYPLGKYNSLSRTNAPQITLKTIFYCTVLHTYFTHNLEELNHTLHPASFNLSWFSPPWHKCLYTCILKTRAQQYSAMFSQLPQGVQLEHDATKDLLQFAENIAVWWRQMMTANLGVSRQSTPIWWRSPSFADWRDAGNCHTGSECQPSS
jgi:hypothetical protein